ncbi:NYN domain protein [Candidatus Magnetobacterium bavaricum]|uniref:NYN domain protein n=1 Tax=Candidatus Magnetobacterium bavaricum TaxID=29290 RepID=A0A0F3GK46_9BACT|nr:NYN domain protein [Candidatus Magnetobacterium bavaricum]
MLFKHNGIILRTYVYIDGFNLYYRAVRNTHHKWLDLKLLSENLLGIRHEILKIKYFTAIVSGYGDPQRPIRQKTYIRALKKHISIIEVYYGHFLSHIVRLPLANPLPNRTFENVIKTEEKASDVNLAVHLLNDAWSNAYDCAVIFSNDSDFAEAIQLVKKLNKTIGLIIPPNCNPSQQLLRCVDFKKPMRAGVLSASQLPNPIPDSKIHKPLIW